MNIKDIKLYVYTQLLNFFLRRKKFNKVNFFLEKKKKLALKIRNNLN